MRVAALYDIHGNLPALEAVLGAIGEVDALVIGGDVLPGPMPLETLERLLDLDLPIHFIRGNGDREILAAMAGREMVTVPEQFRAMMRWNAGQLRPEHAQVLAGWPKTLSLEIPPLGQVLFCHATPRDDNEIFTRLTSEERLQPIFEQTGAAVVVCGHTHMQFDRMVGKIRVINAGSVGMPFGEPGAYWLSLGPEVRLRNTQYDFEKAAAEVRATKYPQAEEFAAGNILRPPTEAVMLAAFNR